MQNSVILKWMLPELSIPAAGQKDRGLWGREWYFEGCVRLARYCGKMWGSHLFFTQDCDPFWYVVLDVDLSFKLHVFILQQFLNLNCATRHKEKVYILLPSWDRKMYVSRVELQSRVHWSVVVLPGHAPWPWTQTSLLVIRNIDPAEHWGIIGERNLLLLAELLEEGGPLNLLNRK